MHFRKLSVPFSFKFYQFLPVFDLLTDQEHVLKTHLALDPPAKNSNMELGRGSKVVMRTQYPA